MSTDEPIIEGEPDEVEEADEKSDRPIKPRRHEPKHEPYDDPMHIPPPII